MDIWPLETSAVWSVAGYMLAFFMLLMVGPCEHRHLALVEQHFVSPKFQTMDMGVGSPCAIKLQTVLSLADVFC